MPRSGFWLAMFLVAIVLLIATGCGSGSAGSSNPSPTPTPAPVVGGVNPPTVVTLAAGQSVSGTDISVSASASSPAVNAQVLGATATTDPHGSADNTGTIVMRGSTVTVLLFGPGLSGSMQVSISGPPDIGISQIKGIQSTTNVPGIEFQAVITGNAALGARTVVLQSSNGDITTFTGGLDIQ